MKRWIFIFCFVGGLEVVSGISGISAFSAGSGGTAIARYADDWPRCVAGAFGAVLLFFAWAIYRRRRWIWRLMFYFLGISWAGGVVTIYSELSRQYPKESVQHTMILAGLFALIIAIIIGYWCYAWYQTRGSFFPEEEDDRQ